MKKKIAVFTTGWCAEILSQFLRGMMGTLENDQADIFDFLCFATHSDTEEHRHGELNIYNLPDLHDFDGTVIFGSGLDYKDKVDNIIERSKEAGIPIVIQSSKRDGISYVGSDNYQATLDMCDHLKKHHGVKTISYIAGSRDSLDSEIRHKAILDYLCSNNCEADLVEVFSTEWENAAVTRHLNELSSSGAKLPDAFICANDGLAMETCITLSNLGYDVPGDVLVTGYDYIDDSRVFYPAIASVDQCFEEMGAASARLWQGLLNGEETKDEVVLCKFIPGDSCNCFEFRNSDLLRRQKGREAFSKRSLTTYFNRKLDIVDATVLSCYTYEDFKRELNELLTNDHGFEGDSFHLLMEPKFGQSIYDADIKLNTDRYSPTMDVLYSIENGVTIKDDLFRSRDLVPGYDPDGPNHIYAFLPLHEANSAFGYLVFRDCIDKIDSRFIRTYQNRMCLVFDKFRHALTLDFINKRLVDLMRRDPLTNVNNRMAYEDKEKHLQEQIESDPNVKFAIAMFDVNSLKLVNDSYGHEAGDDYLLRACRLICDVFRHSPVYRIGGDEFVAVLTGDDYDKRNELTDLINERMNPYSDRLPLPTDYVSIACGIGVYDQKKDTSVAEVVRRADEEMYNDKATKKKRGNNNEA